MPSVSSKAQSVEPRAILDDSEDEAADTPLSSQSIAKTASVAKDQDTVMADAEDEDEDGDMPVTRRPARNTRAGFLIDSDSE